MGVFVNAYEGRGVGSSGVRRNVQTNVRCDLESWFVIRPLWRIVQVALDWSGGWPCFFSFRFVFTCSFRAGSLCSSLCGSHMR